MRAMVLAAGVGSRLKPLTDTLPKALVEVGGVTMLERAIRALVAAGADGIIVNAFHHAGQIERYVDGHAFGVPVKISLEEVLLDTGGGILKAAPFLNDGRPFIVHNVDIVTTVDLVALYRSHLERPALATLAARERPGSRRLIFDSDGLLRGREGEIALPPAGLALAFDGIHILSPSIFGKLTERGVFSMMPAYLRLAAAGEPIRAFRTDGSIWAEIGTPDRLEAARRLAQTGAV